MSQTDLTAEEVLDSLTGHDEVAIAHHFGQTWTSLAEADSSMLSRALAFIVKRREGATDDDARNAAMGLTVKELGSSGTFFAAASAEKAGKGESPETSPEPSPTSVS